MDYRMEKPFLSILGHNAEINSIDLYPENEFLYITGSGDKTAALWDLRKPELKMHSFIHHKNSILNVKWNNKRCNIFASSNCSFFIHSKIRLVLFDISSKSFLLLGSKYGMRFT